MALVLGGLVIRAQESIPASGTAGTPWTGAPGIRETSAQIMAREARSGTQGRRGIRPVKPSYLRNARNLPQNPDSPLTSHWPLTGGTSAAAPATAQIGPRTPQLIGTSFLGAQFSDTVGYVPPDSMGDVGINQIVVCVNGRIRSFTRNGVADGALDTTTDSFFASVLHSSSTSDPRVRFDRLSGRWFITMITVNTPNFVLIAVSSGPTITSASSFTFFSFQADASNFGDYDTLGVDANALYIGVNVFSGSFFVNTTGFVVNKANLLSGTLTATTFANLISGGGHPHGPFTPQGVNNDDPAATQGYFIGVDDRSTGTLALRRVSNPGGTPTISANILITVPATITPSSVVSVPALGSSLNLSGLDARLFATRMHQGSLWTAHNLPVDSSGNANSSGGRVGSRWYQLANLTSTPTLVQSGTLFDPAGSNPRNYWIPSCAMSGQGHMALGCSVAGSSEHAEIATAGRLAGDPLGTIQPPTTAVTSSSTYNTGAENNAYRWGDFSVTTVDPADDMTFWTVQEYCNANNSWGVQVIKLLAPPPASPLNCSPSTVTQGMANVSVVLNGSSASGTGFFDPGAGFPNHIAASVNGGGVSLNSITYNNPTSVTMNLTVAANTATGTRTVTVTNPDGQSATSLSGIITIAAVGNLPPTLAAISNRTIAVGMTLTITNVADDVDGDVLSFSLGAGEGTNVTINPTNGIFSWMPSQSQIGSNAFSVIVGDSGVPSLSATQSFNVTVVQSNSPPMLPVITSRTIAVGMTLTITNVASDTDGDLLAFSLGAGAANNATINATNGIFQWTPTPAQIGTNAFSVVVTDSGLPPLSATQSFSVTVLASNNPPVLTAISDRTIAEGMTLTITNVATDPDSPPQVLTFSLGAGAATNAIIDATNGVFTWTPTQGQIGSNAFEVIVTDNGLQPLSATQSFSVTVLASNNPPVLAAIADRTVVVGMTLTITNVATDPDSPPQVLTFGLGAGAATNAVIDATSGVFTWTPTQADIGTNAFSIIVTDNGLPPLSATQSFSVMVLASNNPPVLAAVSDRTIAGGMTLTITNMATDPDSPPQVLTFSLDAGAPAGASIGAADGVFMWTASDSQAGANSITVRVTDNGLPNLSDAKTFTVSVLVRPVLEAIVMAGNSATLTWDAISGTTYRIQFKTNLTDAAWSDLAPDVTATGATASASDPSSTNDMRFYRILVVP